MKSTPSSTLKEYALNRFFIEKSRRLPISGKYDVAVAGAGVAGAAAAVSASRNGAKTCLIEKETSPGGLATLGLIAIYLPLCDGDGNKVISGIPEELLKLSLKYGPGEIPECWMKRTSIKERARHRYRAVFNPASFVISLEELLLKNKIDIFYDSRLSSCLMNGRKIKAVVIENKSGRSAVTAKAFVDATGDADLCFFAGEKTVSLDNNKKAGWYVLYDYGELKLVKLGDNPAKRSALNEKSFSGTDARAVTEFCVSTKKLILSHLKNSSKCFSTTYPASLPCVPQFRMTRRLKGLYELDESEEREYFKDAVCMTGDWRKPGRVFYIPFRCLAGKTKNLFAAGRCISVTESMWDITRAIPACAATGEAAGAAAALSAAGRHKSPNRSFQDCLRNSLVRQGVKIVPDFSEK